MRGWVKGLGTLALAGVGVFLWITAPQSMTNVPMVHATTNDIDRGGKVFAVAGCANCHKTQGQADPLQLGGGMVFDTPFGQFAAPNISMDPDNGIGAWGYAEFYAALKWGQSPDGRHYYPVFPYSSYTHISDADIAALWAFWQNLPAVERPSQDHDLWGPARLRRAVGGWKWLYMPDGFERPDPAEAAYLVEGLAHCAQCHTPRDILGGLDTAAWMRGGDNPSGSGRIPSIHPDDLGWSRDEIIEYLSSGFTPEYDMAGGKMADVIESLSVLSAEEKGQIADYLLALE